MTTPPLDLLGVRSAAQQLGVHENTLRRWEESGLVRAVRLPSGVRRFRVEDIEELREQMYSDGESHDRAIAAAAGGLRKPARAAAATATSAETATERAEPARFA